MLKTIQLLILAAVTLPLAAADAPAEDRAGELQAVFIYNFTRFITWPAPDTATADSAAPFTIAVIGSSAVTGHLRNIAELKTVDGRPIRVRQYTGPDAADSCQVLFITPRPDDPALQAILAAAEGRPVLTVSASPGYAGRGVAINFFTEDNRTKFEINHGALVDAGLKASSQLLKLGVLVDDQRQGRHP